MPTTPTVATAMTEPVVTAGPTETLGAVASRMHEHRIGSVVVVEGEPPHRHRDRARPAAGHRRRPTPPTPWCGTGWCPTPTASASDSAIDQAWQQLAERGYRHIPVVAGDSSRASSRCATWPTPSSGPQANPRVAPPGLKGVVVAETALGDVRGGEGFYHYRQYAALELAAAAASRTSGTCSSTAPCPRRPSAPPSPTRSHRSGCSRPPSSRRCPPSPRRIAAPVAALRTGISLLAEGGPSRIAGRRRRADAHRRGCALRRCAHPDRRAAPAAPGAGAGAAARRPALRRQLPAHDHRRRPDPVHARAIEQYLILGVDHGFNASTFTARVIASTGADLVACLVGALGSLSGPARRLAEPGPRHPRRHRHPERIDAWVRERVLPASASWASGTRSTARRIPRSRCCGGSPRGRRRRRGVRRAGRGQIVAILAELKPGRELHTNVEYYAGVVMHLCGLPREMFTPTFAPTRSSVGAPTPRTAWGQ